MIMFEIIHSIIAAPEWLIDWNLNMLMSGMRRQSVNLPGAPVLRFYVICFTVFKVANHRL